MADNLMFKKAYHVTQGEVEMYAVDAKMAVSNFPKEWSFEPWPDQDEPAPKGKKGAKAADNTGDDQ